MKFLHLIHASGLRVAAIVCSVLLLAACASTPNSEYNAYLQAVAAADQREQAARGSIADAAASCNGNETCVVAVAGFAALSLQSGGQRGAGIQPYRKQFHPAWNILGQAIPAVIQGAVSWRQSDNSRDIAMSQHDFIGGMVDSIVSSPALTPRDPSITVGGDYVTGEQHIGDAIGRDAIGGDQHVGDWHQGDAIGGDDNSGNSGRINSPGPYDDNSGQCTGTGCQGDGDHGLPVDPEPDPGNGG